MKYLIPALVLVLVGAGCTPAVSTTTHFSSPELGLAFDYPTAWGTPVIDEGEGERFAVDSPTCIYMRTVSFPNVGPQTVLAAAAREGNGCEIPGRDGFWGDKARLIGASYDHAATCKTGPKAVCTSSQNTEGITVWQTQFAAHQVPFDDMVIPNMNEYALHNPGHAMEGVIISEETLHLNSHADQTDELRALVESISFVGE